MPWDLLGVSKLERGVMEAKAATKYVTTEKIAVTIFRKLAFERDLGMLATAKPQRSPASRTVGFSRFRGGALGFGWAMMLLSGADAGWSMELNATGELGFQYYLTQDNRYKNKEPKYGDLLPGSRLLLSLGHEARVTQEARLFFDVDGQVLAARLDTAFFKMDRIRYALAAGARYSLSWSHWASLTILHDCIHAIDRRTLNDGSAFWTLVRLDLASAGIDELRLGNPTGRYFRQGLDYSVGVGKFLDQSLAKYASHQNDYSRYAETVLRYSLAWGSWGLAYADWRQEFWDTRKGPLQYKGLTQVGVAVPGVRNGKAIINAGYSYLDQMRFDNEHSLWSIGLRLMH